MNRKVRGKNKFQENWLSLEKYKIWLTRKSENIARCKLCFKDINVENMGECALKSHMATSKHTKLVKEKEEARKSLSVLHFLPVTSDKENEHPTSSTTRKVTQSVLQDVSTSIGVISAEIRWTIKTVMSHFSMRSCLDISSLFKAMFPDSDIAKNFQMSKTKVGYYITFGIAPYFKNLLLRDIKDSPFYSVLFDESLNKIFQEEQMDIQIRFWNNSSNLACTRYLDSQYLHRPNADNLVKALNDSLVNLDTTRMIHLSMDGPNTNWKVLKSIQNSRQENEQASLVNLQSCGLHVVSGALQNGVNSCNWNLDKVFTYKFLHVYCICRNILDQNTRVF